MRQADISDLGEIITGKIDAISRQRAMRVALCMGIVKRLRQEINHRHHIVGHIGLMPAVQTLGQCPAIDKFLGNIVNPISLASFIDLDEVGMAQPRRLAASRNKGAYQCGVLCQVRR